MTTYHIVNITATAILFLFTCCNSHSATEQQIESGLATSNQVSGRVGGRCETCELINVDMPANISATDTSAAWDAAKQKLVVSGTIYEPDGKTPAPNIVLYYWQTNENGVYANSKELAPAARRHGYIRGWVKTDQNGQYTIYTTRPGSYPNGRNPAHIHLLIKEPDIPNEYYIDDVLFEDDPLLTEEVKNQLENKGGNGVSKVWQDKDVQKVKRDVILGKNIENYPSKK